MENATLFGVISTTENSSNNDILDGDSNNNNNKNNGRFIMVLDDDFDIVFPIKRGLQRNGYTVFAFTDPHLALEHFKINSSKYYLVISDLRMPSMNGLEFLKNVKRIRSDIKIFLMTAFEIDDLESSITSLKVNEFIAKPFPIEKLNAIIDKYYLFKKVQG